MRSVAALLLLALVIGCSGPAPAGSSGTAAPGTAKWPFAALLEQAAREPCDVSATRKNPVVGPVTAMALQPREHWVPGGPFKINWESPPDGASEIDIELRRAGSSELAYRLHRMAGPSLVGIPEPGCWDVTVRSPAKTGTVRVYFAPARPVGLLAARGLAIQRPADAPTAEWIDDAVGLQLLDAASANASTPARGRKSAELFMLWQSSEMRTESPLVYVAPGNGEGAQLIMQKSLVTGDCREANVPFVVAIPSQLASQIETRLGSHLLLDESEKVPWRLFGAGCERMAKP